MVDSVANTPAVSISTKGSQIKVATPEIILLSNDSLPVEIMSDLIFEDIGGQEIINIARYDTINGQNLIYQPIKNLAELALSNSPQNIISIQNTSVSYFKNFPIRLSDKIPDVGNGPNGDNVYLEESTGNLVVEVINLASDEQVEIQIISTGTVLDDTIY